MSEEQFKAFLEAVKADAGLKEKLNAAANADVVVEIAKKAGFVISIEELWKLNELSELSAEELERASGGRIGDRCSQLGKDILNNYTAAIWCKS